MTTINLHDYPPGLLAIPTVDWMWTASAIAIMELRGRLPPKSGIRLLTQSYSSIAAKREELAETLVRLPDLKWLCYLDSDMTPSPHAVARLLSLDLDIVGASCVSRHPPYPRAVRWFDRAPTAHEMQAPVKVSAVGFGMVLIKRHVFERLSRPWFAERHDTPGRGEDYNFCDRAREAGFDVHIDMQLEVGHVGVTSITPIYHDLYAQTQEGRSTIEAVRASRDQ